MLLAWQISQPTLLDTGMCNGDCPATDLGVTPSKVPTTTLAPWQLAQPVVMPVWLKAELLKCEPSGTGVEAMLEPPPTWQLAQPRAPMGMWLMAGVLMGASVVVAAYKAALSVL